MLYYFTNAGEPYTSFEDTGDEAVTQNLAIKADVPEGIESWRLSLNPETNAVSVAYEGMSEEDALAQKLIDEKVIHDAEMEVAVARRAASIASIAEGE